MPMPYIETNEFLARGYLPPKPPTNPAEPSVLARAISTLDDTAGVANRLQSLVERLDGPSPSAQSNPQEGPPPGLLNALSAEVTRARENISRSHDLLDVIERLLS